MAYVNTGYKLRLYFDTGINGIDIIGDPAILDSASYVDYDDTYYIRQDLDLPQIMIKANYDDVKNADYARLTPISTHTKGTTAYYFCSPTSLSYNTTMLALELDALLTMGGAENLEYLSGWIERGHIAKSDDTLFSNIAPEDFIPRMPLITRAFESNVYPKSDETYSDKDLHLIYTNIDLFKVSTDGQNITIFNGTDTNGSTKMYIPKIVTNESSVFTYFNFATGIKANDESGTTYTTYTYHIPRNAIYPINGNIKNSLEALYSAGQLDLIASYVLPGAFVGSANLNDNGYYSSISCAVLANRLSSYDTGFNFQFTIDNYTVKNKKVYSLYNTYMLGNVASGASIIKNADELYESGHSSPRVIVWADPSPNGRPYARFYYERDNASEFMDNVAGSPWCNDQLVFNGASGSLWNTIDAAFNNSTYTRQLMQNNYDRSYIANKYSMDVAQNIANAAGSIANSAGDLFYGDKDGGIHNPISNITDIATTSVNAVFTNTQLALNKEKADFTNALQRDEILQDINQNRIGLLKNTSVVAPTSLFTPSDTMSLYGLNTYVAGHVTMTDEDVAELDSYFQRYGYNGIHKPLTAAALKTRTYYNYVQAFDINIKSDFARRIRMKAISQLNSGVRIWHTLPDVADYELN